MEDGPALRRIIPTLEETIEPHDAGIPAGRPEDRVGPLRIDFAASLATMIVGTNLAIGWAEVLLALPRLSGMGLGMRTGFSVLSLVLLVKVVLDMQRRAARQGRVRLASVRLRAVIEDYVERARRQVKDTTGGSWTEIDYQVDVRLVDPPFAGVSTSTHWTSRRGRPPQPGTVAEVVVETNSDREGRSVPRVHGFISDFDHSYGGALFFCTAFGFFSAVSSSVVPIIPIRP